MGRFDVMRLVVILALFRLSISANTSKETNYAQDGGLPNEDFENDVFLEENFEEELRPNNCRGNPCQNGGLCIENGSTFKCLCKPSFLGKKCENGPCTSSPCKNGGICMVSGSSFKCICQKPYSGIKCESDPCTGKICHNGGICTFSGNISKCSCVPPYFGEKCEAKCPCVNGTCEKDSMGNIRCQCLPGYTSVAPMRCEACNCGGEVNCTFSNTTLGRIKTCLCPKGYKDVGGTCVGPCTKNPCLNGGVCIMQDNGYRCECAIPYTGFNCESDPCNSRPKPCNGRGTCVMEEADFKCFCNWPYSGKRCELDPCSRQPCKNGGTCIIGSESYQCLCKTRYLGKNCENEMCDPRKCQQGKCKFLNGLSICQCDSGYTGVNCDKFHVDNKGVNLTAPIISLCVIIPLVILGAVFLYIKYRREQGWLV